MMKITLIAINIALAIFLYFLNTWYEQEDIQIQKINKKYVTNTRKLKEIEKIDKWLSAKVKQNLTIIPKDSQNADLKLIAFFDTYAKKYTFQVEKFIYNDERAHFLNIKYSLPRENYKYLVQFMQQKYKGGYKILQNFAVDKATLQGELILVQPYLTAKKKKEAIVDDVPK